MNDSNFHNELTLSFMFDRDINIIYDFFTCIKKLSILKNKGIFPSFTILNENNTDIPKTKMIMNYSPNFNLSVKTVNSKNSESEKYFTHKITHFNDKKVEYPIYVKYSFYSAEENKTFMTFENIYENINAPFSQNFKNYFSNHDLCRLLCTKTNNFIIDFSPKILKIESILINDSIIEIFKKRNKLIYFLSYLTSVPNKKKKIIKENNEIYLIDEKTLEKKEKIISKYYKIFDDKFEFYYQIENLSNNSITNIKLCFYQLDDKNSFVQIVESIKQQNINCKLLDNLSNINQFILLKLKNYFEKNL
jgi:hypothetical protein